MADRLGGELQRLLRSRRLATLEVAGRVRGQPSDPRPEDARIPQRAEAGPGLERHFLGEVERGLRIRLDQLEEALTIIDGLQTTDGFSFEGEHWQLEAATYDPKPVQQPRIPLWVAATGPKRGLPMAARHADAWHSFGGPDEMVPRSQHLSQLAEEAGRDPGDILRSATLDLSQPWDAVRADAEAFRAGGFGYLICGWPSEGRAHLEHFAEHLLPELAAD